MTDDLTKTHVLKVLEIRAEWQASFTAKVRELEAAGRILVDAGQAGSYGDDGRAPWEVTDWRTGKPLASGRGTYEEFIAEFDRLNSEGRWQLIGPVIEEHGDPGYPATPGLPDGLAAALEEWVETTGEPEEVAAWTGAPVDYVAQCMREESDAARAA